jgi:uncharacterized protein (DUF1800 family)
MISVLEKIKHFYWRAGCGLTAIEYKSVSALAEEIDKVFLASRKFEPITFEEIKKFGTDGSLEVDQMKGNNHNNGVWRVSLGYIWLQKLVVDPSFVREKMAFFWSNHFACQINSAAVALDFTNSIRQHALGKFPDLLFAVSKSAAMSGYLNIKKNIKAQPNENFARELMELFTLGRGNYSETDVREAARALTGWSINKDLKFYINTPYHDDGVKTFLGKSGNFSGDDILNAILANKQCAIFLTRKIYRYFVNEIPDERRIEVLANDFFSTGYDIERLMRTIFSSAWFYEDKNVGNRIKSPLDLLAGMMKSVNVRMANSTRFLAYMRMTGQEIFQPPNVAGWPIGKAWIDNSRLLVRLTMPQWIFQKKHPVIQPQNTFDAQDIQTKNVSEIETSLITFNFDVLKNLSPDHTDPSPELLAKYFLPIELNDSLMLLLKKYAAEDFKLQTIKMMALPEYQLC